MKETCYFTDHEIGWGGDCHCCGKCGKVFVPKPECKGCYISKKEGLIPPERHTCNESKEFMKNGWYTNPHNNRFYATSSPFTIDGKKVSMREYYLEMVEAKKI